MLAWLTGPLAGPILGVALLASLIGGATEYLVSSWKISSLESDNSKLSTSINDPKTGYVARQAQCETNIATLSGGLDRANASILNLAKEEAAAKAAADKAALAAAAGAKAAKSSAAHILSLQPSGDVCKAALDLLRNPNP